jgi:putative phosphoribosyl transferase
MIRSFIDRREAGKRLAERLKDEGYAGQANLVVLGLPRGGVPVAYEVAEALEAPLDVFLVRKLGTPDQPELAMGAIASGNIVVLNDEVVDALRIGPSEIKAAVARESDELRRRERAYRDDRPPLEVEGRTVILVDDGLATGSTMRAAIAAIRKRHPARVIVGVPVAAPATCAEFQSIADDCVCVHTPEPFRAVGLWYDDFSQTRDAEVVELLAIARGHRELGDDEPAGQTDAVDTSEVAIPADGRVLRGTLRIPRGASLIVVFAHGSGSGRNSPRNRFVASVLEDAGLGTLLIDLLGEDEASNRAKVFDIGLLADRLQAVADWLKAQSQTRSFRLAYFGASTGAGAALRAAAISGPGSVAAVVSRGGRPDLANEFLPSVTAPTLLIVGGADEIVLELNREAFDRLLCPRQLDIVPGATHLFPEPGALEEVARLAREWFLSHQGEKLAGQETPSRQPEPEPKLR